jgi:hypothetical protein
MKHPSKPAGSISVQSISWVQAYLTIYTIYTTQKLGLNTLSSPYLQVTISIQKYFWVWQISKHGTAWSPLLYFAHVYRKSFLFLFFSCAQTWHKRCPGLLAEVWGTNVMICYHKCSEKIIKNHEALDGPQSDVG